MAISSASAAARPQANHQTRIQAGLKRNLARVDAFATLRYE